MHVSDETAKNPSIHRHVKLGTKDHLFLTACSLLLLLYVVLPQWQKRKRKECFLFLILTDTFNSLKVF